MELSVSIQQLKKGDNKPFDVLFLKWNADLIFYAYYFLKDNEASKDIVQEVFLKLINMDDSSREEKLPDNETEMLYLLKAITKNKCIDYIRIKKNRLLIIKNLFSNSKDNVQMPEYFISDIINIIAQKLPSREYEVLKLNIEGYKNEEIASLLNISINTVRNTLHNARKKAQQYWNIFNN